MFLVSRSWFCLFSGWISPHLGLVKRGNDGQAHGMRSKPVQFVSVMKETDTARRNSRFDIQVSPFRTVDHVSLVVGCLKGRDVQVDEPFVSSKLQSLHRLEARVAFCGGGESAGVYGLK